MSFNATHIARLIYNSMAGELPPEDKAALQEWLEEDAKQQAFYESVKAGFTGNDLKLHEPENLGRVRARILQSVNDRISTGDANPFIDLPDTDASGALPVSTVRRVRFLKTSWLRYAAVLLLIAGAATFLYLNNRPQKQIAFQSSGKKNDILPGGNKAILTLADGSTIILDSAANGDLASQGNTTILKIGAGALAYRPGNADGELLYNTISTPKGGQYQISLPDGSKVWLNASSSIRFPTAFASERRVMITGEVYMEVVPDKAKPFIVKAADTEVRVLGTAFNINAYPDETTVKTTLVEGSVKIAGNVLKPGQAFTNGQLVSTNVEQDVAWKNGLFDFQDKKLPEVMRQLARWYDINVIYENGIPDVEFGGEMGRNLKLSTVLTFLKKTNIHFKLEGSTLTVMP